MTEQMDKWMRLHYESGQVPLNQIRATFREAGFDLTTGFQPNDRAFWITLHNWYNTRHQDTVAQTQWEAFREACDRLGYRPAPVDRAAQESTTERLPEAPVAHARIEARSRVVGQVLGTLQWTPDPTHPGIATPPVFTGDVGVDLSTTEDVTVWPRGVHYVPLGVRFAAPKGAWILLIGRSSLASKLGLGMVPGVIDNGFRGEMLAGLFNLNPEGLPVDVPAGTRVAQAILIPMHPTMLLEVETLPESERGENGFGSTGGH